MSNATDLNVTTQWLVEAIKFAYGQRGDLADPAFVSNVTALEALFLEKNTGAVIRSLIKNNGTYQPEEYDPSTYFSLLGPDALAFNESGTSHMVTADEDGLVVSPYHYCQPLLGSSNHGS